MTTQKPIIRSMTRDEIDVALEWQAQAGWNPGLYDADAFHRVNPNGFFIALLGDDPIGMISATAYSDQFGFIGFHHSEPGKHKESIWQQLLEQALAHLGDRTIGLETRLSEQAAYTRWGFEPLYRTIRYQTTGGEPPKHTQYDLVPLDQIPASVLQAYDSALFPAPRAPFLRLWARQQEAVALAMLRSDRIVGYGVLRRCFNGYRVAPLFADSPQVAKELFRVLASEAPGAVVSLDVPEANSAAPEVARMLKMQPISESVRMYRGTPPDLPIAAIYGVTSLELG
jgi:hypothetical protein